MGKKMLKCQKYMFENLLHFLWIKKQFWFKTGIVVWKFTENLSNSNNHFIKIAHCIKTCMKIGSTNKNCWKFALQNK